MYILDFEKKKIKGFEEIIDIKIHLSNYFFMVLRQEQKFFNFISCQDNYIQISFMQEFNFKTDNITNYLAIAQLITGNNGSYM